MVRCVTACPNQHMTLMTWRLPCTTRFRQMGQSSTPSWSTPSLGCCVLHPLWAVVFYTLFGMLCSDTLRGVFYTLFGVLRCTPSLGCSTPSLGCYGPLWGAVLCTVFGVFHILFGVSCSDLPWGVFCTLHWGCSHPLWGAAL